MLFTYFNRKQIAFSFLLLFPLFWGCKKRTVEERPVQATLQIFNALDDGENVWLNLSGNRPVKFNSLARANNREYIQSRNLIYLKDSPSPIDIYTLKDTLPHQQPVISSTVSLNPGAIYSFFIYGEKSSAAWSLFKDDIPPINRQDSTTHVRIANFSEAQAITVNIKDQAPGSLVQNLAYKSLSAFTELAADRTVAGYTFEIRDQETGVLLATYSTTNFQAVATNQSQWLAKSNTLVFTGKPQGVNPNNQKITLMNHR